MQCSGEFLNNNFHSHSKTVMRLEWDISWISILNCLNYFVKIHRWNALILESSFKIDFSPKCSCNDNVYIYSREHLLCAWMYFHTISGLLNNNAANLFFLRKILPCMSFFHYANFWFEILTYYTYTIIQNFRWTFFLAHCGAKVRSWLKRLDI